MRLIDLNKIDVFNQEPEDVVFDIIHAKPEYAIPVVWLRKWFKDKYEEKTYERLIEEWEEENEI